MNRWTAMLAAGMFGMSGAAPAASLEALEHGFDGLVTYYATPHLLTGTNALLISIKLQPGLVDGDPLGLAAYFAALSSCSGGAHDQFELHALYPQFAEYIKTHAGGVSSEFTIEATGSLGPYDFQASAYPLNLGSGYAVYETLNANEGQVVRAGVQIGAEVGTWRSEGVAAPATAMPYHNAYLDGGVNSPCASGGVPQRDRNPQGQQPQLLPENVYFDKVLTVRSWPMPQDQAKRLHDRVLPPGTVYNQTGDLVVRARATMTGIGPSPANAYGPRPPVLFATIDPVLTVCARDDLDCKAPLAQYTAQASAAATASNPTTPGNDNNSTAKNLGTKAGQALFNILSGKHQ